MIDFHCHIDLYPDPAAVVAGCEKRGTYVLAVTTTPRAWEGNLALIDGKSRIRLSPGLHPELVPERHSELPILLNLISRSRYVGEVGIDGGPSLKQHIQLQDKVFRATLSECARRGGRVISIHSRGAPTQVLDALEAHRGAGIPVLHWFSGSQRELARAIQLGCWFSVGPAMLKSQKGSLLAQQMPRDRVLTETDAPFVQHRGQPLMPWDADQALSTLGSCWDETTDAVLSQIMKNFRSLTAAAQLFETLA
ncbi:MAG: Qat anti-phage system TatD family nuclease QatD [Hyphomicrobiaceae bacterium]